MFETTNFIFCRFSDNKMVFITLKYLFVKTNLYKMINVIITIQKLDFKNNTGKHRNQSF